MIFTPKLRCILRTDVTLIWLCGGCEQVGHRERRDAADAYSEDHPVHRGVLLRAAPQDVAYLPRA